MQKVLNEYKHVFFKLLNFLNKNIGYIIFIGNEKLKETYMNLDKLKGIIPDEVLSQIPQTIEKFEINTPLRLAHFLAQCGHESGNWKFKVENLNYSAQALQSVFRKYFPDEATAAQYARKPEMIANKVYASRMANGDEKSGDGWKFRGRGYIQLTGRQNYTSFDKVVDDNILSNTDLVADKYPLLSAAWFWDTNNLSTLADKGATDTDVTAITKRVNGGTHGLDDRLSKFKKYYELLG